MTKMDKRAEDREALERLLDIYGADRTRWPARERLRFAGVVSEDKLAARMLAEADALDQLLEQAPRASSADVDALKERIMAAALRAQRAAACRRCFGQAGFGQGRPPRRPTGPFNPRFTRSQWPAAGMLAASLVLGVMLGWTGTLDTTMQEMAEVGRPQRHHQQRQYRQFSACARRGC